MDNPGKFVSDQFSANYKMFSAVVSGEKSVDGNTSAVYKYDNNKILYETIFNQDFQIELGHSQIHKFFVRLLASRQDIYISELFVNGKVPYYFIGKKGTDGYYLVLYKINMPSADYVIADETGTVIINSGYKDVEYKEMLGVIKSSDSDKINKLHEININGKNKYFFTVK